MKNYTTKKLCAAIFDVDGLILDSEVFYAKAWADAFNNNSPTEYQVDEEIMKEWFYNNLSGKKIGQQLDFVQQCFQNNDIPKIYEEYRKLFNQRLQSEAIAVREGVFELINFLQGKNIKLGIVSTSSMGTIKKSFKNSNIDINIFDVIISGDMGLEYKPSPQPYLKACNDLKVGVDNVIVFEDSTSGLLSATNAGAKCFLVPGRAPILEETKTKAFAVCEKLSDAISLIENCFFSQDKKEIL